MSTHRTTPQATLFFWLLVVLPPLAFVPITVSPGESFRTYLLAWIGLLSAGVWAFQSWRSQRLALWFSPLNWVWPAIAILTALSALAAPMPLSQLGNSFWALVGLGLIGLFTPFVVQKWSWSQHLNGWLMAALVPIVAFWWQLTPWPLSQLISQAIGAQLNHTVAFTLLPSNIAFISLLLTLLVAGVAQFLTHESSERKNPPYFLLTTVALTALTLLTLSYKLWQEPNLRPVHLPYAQGWTIALEQFKSPKFLLLGIGPERFPVAFNTSRTADLNDTPLWNVSFVQSSSAALEFAATLGLPALGLWLFGFFLLWKHARLLPENERWPITGALAVQVVHFFLMPFSVVNYFLVAGLVVAVITRVKQTHPTVLNDVELELGVVSSGNKSGNAGVFARTVAAVSIALALLLFWWSGRAFAAEVVHLRSLKAIQSQDAVRAYQLQQSMVALDPYNPVWRAVYAETNYIIAKSMYSQEGELSEEDRTTAVQLLQQAIREARVATELEPGYTEAWSLLGTIYTDVRETEGAADWALAALTRAAQLTPNDPRTRVNLANFLNLMEDQNQTARLYEQAIGLKSDWYVPYYLYADFLLKTESDAVLPLAYNLLKQGQQLTPTADPLYELIQQRLTTIEPRVQELLKAQEQATQSAQTGEQPTNPSNTQLNTLPDAPLPEEEPNFEDLLNEDSFASDSATTDPTVSSQPDGNIVLPEFE